jgi:hypothetical protein
MKADERLRHIPVIMITVVAEIEITIRCPNDSMFFWMLPAIWQATLHWSRAAASI